MSDKPKRDDEREEQALTELLGGALGAKGELPPTTEEEVLRAEQAGVEWEGELPESLAELRPPAAEAGATEPARAARGAELVSLDEARRKRGPSVGTHVLAAALGAAAAAALIIWRSPPKTPGAGTPTVESARVTADAAPPEKLALRPVRSCAKECCAGSACSAAKEGLESCSSGRTCIACSIESLAESRYRVRLGAFAPSEAGQALLKGGTGTLELCVRAGSSGLVCAPARSGSDKAAQWTVLPLTVSVQDAVAGVSIQVRWQGVSQPLAEWQGPVTLNATALCRGLFVKPITAKKEPMGTLSVFLDDAHYVEVARAASSEALLAARDQLSLADVPARLVETTGRGDQRFALVLGPIDKPSAEQLRWMFLDKGRQAQVVLGDDYQGATRELP